MIFKKPTVGIGGIAGAKEWTKGITEVTKQQIKGVIFDLDGTLYTLKGLKIRMTFALFSSLGILRHLSKSRAAIRNREFNDRSSLLNAFYKALSENAHITQDKAKQWYHEAFLVTFVRMLANHAMTRQGLMPLLTKLKQRNVRLAVVSDFGCVVERLHALNISPALFDTLDAAEDYGVLKPSPRPMNALAAKWQLDPSEILVVGDRQDLDGECAAAAGMQFLGICEKKKHETETFLHWNDALKTIEAKTYLE